MLIHANSYTEDFAIPSVSAISIQGRVVEIVGTRVMAEIEGVRIGELVALEDGETLAYGEVSGFSRSGVTITLYGETTGIKANAEVRATGKFPKLQLGASLLGKTVNALGLSQEQAFNEHAFAAYNPTHCPALFPSQVPHKALHTGVAAIDLFTPLVHGQRLGIYAEPGVGKSSLLRSINAHSACDVFVIALIGERRREVVEFVEEISLSPKFAKTVVVQATSDQPAIMRIRAAETAFDIAENFRSRGQQVLVALDSATRLFRAYREAGLAAGELPVRKGYPPSAFARLPKLVERAGAARQGSITALFTVLLSDDVEQDPMIEELKGLTDGHIILSKKMAQRGVYPAIDILRSLSRLESRALSTEHYKLSKEARRILAQHEQEQELLALRENLDQQQQNRYTFVAGLEKLLTQNEREEISLEVATSELANLLARSGLGNAR